MWQVGRSIENFESSKKWLDQYLANDGERADWVIDPRGLIKKATPIFLAKFL